MPRRSSLHVEVPSAVSLPRASKRVSSRWWFQLHQRDDCVVICNVLCWMGILDIYTVYIYTVYIQYIYIYSIYTVYIQCIYIYTQSVTIYSVYLQYIYSIHTVYIHSIYIYTVYIYIYSIYSVYVYIYIYSIYAVYIYIYDIKACSFGQTMLNHMLNCCL